MNAFGESDQKLALQELTKNDMRRYVKDMLEDSRFDQHTGENVSFAVWVLNERLDCECSSKVSIYTRCRGQEDDDDDLQ